MGIGQLQITPIAQTLGLIKAGVQLEALMDIPVQRRAQLQVSADLLHRQPQDRSRVQQIIGKRPKRQALFTMAIPVTQQLELLAQVQVVAPAAIEVLPAAGLVDGHFATRGLQAVFEQAQLHIVDAAGQHPRVECL
ncbi:hypothetical protein D9M71_453050 [compost metagenome]